MGTAFLYGNGGSGGTGATLTVNAPAGATVTVTKDGKTKTKTAGADGVAVFRGLATGQWTVTITDGEQTAQKTVTITADYSTAITFFSATIHITYPAGSTCTATDGVTTLTAPDTSGAWDCVVPNAGTWTVSTGNGFQETVEVSANGEELTLNKWYLYKEGDERTYKTGGIDSKTMIYFSTGNAYPVGTITKNSDNIYLGTKSSNNIQACVATNNKINISNFSKLCAHVSDVSPASADSSWNRLALTSTYNYNKNCIAYAELVAPTTELTIPSEVECYIGIVSKSSKNYTSKATIHEIWLEA